ncbi:hypothetical protein PCANC_10445 [Puccinia coronata f. sp. avenae]|uniref:Uncharacterized protein n=1 Tax=Puccinia coronata f. sp. avenae TaxID=200324 RepID=A0A2N5VI78_9BASI|nr:hypothetical protein PCANC_10445 [Puccinia coronata f. sp. avenae]
MKSYLIPCFCLILRLTVQHLMLPDLNLPPAEEEIADEEVFGLADSPRRSSSIDNTPTHACPSTHASSALLAEEDGISKNLEPVQLDAEISPLNRSPLGSSLGSANHHILTDALDPEESSPLSVKKQRFTASTSKNHQHSDKWRPGKEMADKKIIELTDSPGNLLIDDTPTYAYPSTHESSALLAEEDASLPRVEPVEVDARYSPLNRSPPSSSSTNKQIPYRLEPEALSKRRSLRILKKQQSMKSTSNDDRRKRRKNGENSIRDTAPYPTLLQSKGKQPMETPLEKNFHSNIEPVDDDIFRQDNTNPLFEMLLQVCQWEHLKESPGIEMTTGIEGTSRQSSATVEHKALQLIKQFNDAMPKTPGRTSSEDLAR